MRFIQPVIFSSLLLFFSLLCLNLKSSDCINTNYGQIIEDNQIIHDLIRHPMMQRLKKIHQYGITYYVITDYDYDRYEHSIGVYALLKKFGAPLDEQIAGLLHDVSHTAFSHVGDHFFKHKLDGDSYQDDIHEWFLNKAGFAEILKNYGLKIKDILHKNKRFKLLEQELPNICADRLEYVLHGGILEKILTQNEVDEILNHLRFENGQWFFVDREQAKKFARTSLYLNEFASASDGAANELLAEMLRYAVDAQFLSLDEIHFGFDDEIWQKLNDSRDETIQKYLYKLYHLDDSYEVVSKVDDHTHFIKCKFRGIDPLVKVDQGLERLTSLDQEYQQEFMNLKKKITAGWYLRIK